MSYEPYSRNPSGIVFFGTAANDPLYNSSSDFKIGGGYLSATNIKVSDGGTIGSATTPSAITIASDGDVSIANNLYVNGSLTSVSTDNIVIKDPLMFLASGNSANISDIGFFGQYNDGANNEYAGLFRDATDGKFRLFDSLESKPDASVDTGGTGYSVSTLVANLEGNSSTSTKWSSPIYIQVSDQITGSGAVDGSSDVSFNVQLTEQSINGQPTATVANDSDYILIASGATLRRITKSNFVSGIGAGTMSSFNITDSVTSETIQDGNTLTFLAGSGLSGTVSATDTVTYSLAIQNATGGTVSPACGDKFLTLDSDGSTHQLTSINDLATHFAGSGLISNGCDLLIGAGDGIVVNADEIEVDTDNSTIELSSTDGTGKIRVKDSGITERKLFRNVVTTASDISADSVDINNYDIILANAGSNNVTITLPDNGGDVGEGRIIRIKRLDSNSIYNVTINTESSDTIDGVGSYILYHVYETVSLVNDGTNWYII